MRGPAEFRVSVRPPCSSSTTFSEGRLGFKGGTAPLFLLGSAVLHGKVSPPPLLRSLHPYFVTFSVILIASDFVRILTVGSN